MTREHLCKPPRDDDLHEIRLKVPNPRSPAVRERVARSVASLSPSHEAEALVWIEAVSEFDERPDQAR